MSLNPDMEETFASARSRRRNLLVVSVAGVLISITACGAAKPAAAVSSATATATPVSTSAPSAPSQSCHDLLAANPSVDPSRVPKQWKVYTNAAGVKAIVPSGWNEVSGNFIVSATDPALGHPNNLSLSVFHRQGEPPSAETIVIAEGADLSRSHPDLLGAPEGNAVTLPAGRAARLSYCLPKKESDGTPVTLAFLQLLIPRPAGSGAYDIYLLQMIAPVNEMGYYGVVFELAAKALVLP